MFITFKNTKRCPELIAERLKLLSGFAATTIKIQFLFVLLSIKINSQISYNFFLFYHNHRWKNAYRDRRPCVTPRNDRSIARTCVPYNLYASSSTHFLAFLARVPHNRYDNYRPQTYYICIY